MPAARHRPIQRRTTAAALKQQILDCLEGALPAGWICQPLVQAGRPAAADILIISPRGRCHFLFVRAPADRWWDGGAHSVPAEGVPTEAVCLTRRLRAAGHRTRAVWGAQDLARALRTWGCAAVRPVRLGAPVCERQPSPAKPARPVLHLSGWGRRADA